MEIEAKRLRADNENLQRLLARYAVQERDADGNANRQLLRRIFHPQQSARTILAQVKIENAATRQLCTPPATV